MYWESKMTQSLLLGTRSSGTAKKDLAKKKKKRQDQLKYKNLKYWKRRPRSMLSSFIHNVLNNSKVITKHCGKGILLYKMNSPT